MKIVIIGTGYGGACFPKDTDILYHFAFQLYYEIK